MGNYPVPVSKQELLDVLDDIRARVEAGDSYEGSLEYLMPFDEDMNVFEGADFVLRAGYRIGNRQGQGGFRMVGSMEPVSAKTADGS